MKHFTQDPKPWFKYFWPWFFIVIILWTFASGVGMIYFSSNNPPSIVEGYNKIAKSVIPKNDKFLDKARELGIKASLVIKGNQLYINIHPAAYAKSDNLALILLHPLTQKKDITISLSNDNLTNGITIPANTIDWKIKIQDSQLAWHLIGRLNNASQLQ